MVSVHLLHLAPASSHPNGWTIHCLTGHQRRDWRQKKRMSTNVVNLIIDHLQLGHVVSGKNWVMHGFPRFVASTSLLSPLDICTRIITIFQITRHLKMFMTVLAKATEFWSFLGQQLLNYPSSTVLGYLVIFCNFRPRPMISTLWSGVRMRLEISWLPLAWFRKWIPHKTITLQCLILPAATQTKKGITYNHQNFEAQILFISTAFRRQGYRRWGPPLQ